MKFTNGFWLTRREYTAEYVREIYKWYADASSLTLFAPFKKIEGRGDTLNIGMMTVTCSSPAENVLRIRLTGHAGQIRKGPLFDIPHADYSETKVSTGTGSASITSGKLTLTVKEGSPDLTFTADGKPLTKTGTRGISRMQHADGRIYTVTELALGVGELVYGFGERFTPYVKNGQVVDTWNEDGGTASEIAYKSIPFYMTNKNYGVFVNHPGKVSFETGSEKVEDVQFSVEDESLEYYLIYGDTQKDILSRYTSLTGRAPLLPKWSFGLWLTTSFTTNYDEKTVSSFVDGMASRDIPLRVFHFDCFWMKEFEWCSFEWDRDMFPDPVGMLNRLHSKGLKLCVWINSYIAQKSPLFAEAAEKEFLLRNADGTVWQWDMWQAGMGLVDFTNPQAYAWYQQKLKRLLDMGVDCFKTDFGERIPCFDNGYDVAWYDGSDPEKMHNYYTYLYNKCVFELLEKEKGRGEAVLFARSATAGGQKFPVHWGGDSTSQFVSMAESLRAGLSLMDSGFSFWSHDIGGFEETGSADLYKRWVAFGLFSSHSRLHGSSSYRVPWAYDDEACDVLRFFVKQKCRLMPYIYDAAVNASLTGVPVMRPMHLEFPGDPNCAYLDRQYMFGPDILVAPVFTPAPDDAPGSSVAQPCYLPDGNWVHFISEKKVSGGKWFTDTYDYFSLPVFVREGTIIPTGKEEKKPDYDYSDHIVWQVFPGTDGKQYGGTVTDEKGKAVLSLSAEKSSAGAIVFKQTGTASDVTVVVRNFAATSGTGCTLRQSGHDTVVIPSGETFTINK
ncbi:MAG TPA: alpha-xylosidase [Treponema sp.]|nr:alpha-xylosidase [Treponema sp.]